MTVYLSSIVGSASISVYSLATEDIVIIPTMVPKEKAQEFADWLKTKLIYTSIGGSVLAALWRVQTATECCFQTTFEKKNSRKSKLLLKATSQSWKPKKPLTAT